MNNNKMNKNNSKKIKLKDLIWSKQAGQYDFIIDATYYQLYKYNSYWVVYETETVENNTPYNWAVLLTCSTLKEAKRILLSHINNK